MKNITLMKEFEDTNKLKDILCSWNGKIFLKCPYYLKQPIDSRHCLLKFQRHFSHK